MSALVWIVVIIVVLVGLLQVPLLCDLIRSCAPDKAPKRIVGPLLDTIVVCLMCTIFSGLFYLYFWVFLPAHFQYKDPWSTSGGLYHIAFFWFLFLNTIANYICCCFTKAGTPPKVTMTPDTAMSVSIESCIPKEKICLECKCMKAESTHHCKVCGECIMYMDHHCPFVMGCVGLNNYHYFYPFVLYFYCGMLYGVYMGSGPFWHCHWRPYEDLNYQCDKVSLPSIMTVVISLNIPGGTLINTLNLVNLLANSSTMSCLIEGINAGFVTAARNLLSHLSLRNLTNTRGRLHVMLLSKRQHVISFLVPPLLTAGKLFFKHSMTKKRTIQFKFPKLPKKVSLTA